MCGQQNRDYVWSTKQGHVWSTEQGHVWSTEQGHVWSTEQVMCGPQNRSCVVKSEERPDKKVNITNEH